MRPSREPTWQIWVDTGGTFTDCVAVAPDGTTRVEKVLSSSALRGEVVEVVASDTLRVTTGWRAAPDMIDGFAFRILGAAPGAADTSPTVRAFDADSGIVTLSDKPTPHPTPGDAFEVISPEEAPVLAARMVTRAPEGSPLPAMAMRLATTLGTNALLEQGGAPVALFVTEGFADLLVIGTQQRPDLFALDIRKPPPFYAKTVEVPERLTAEGKILRALDPSALDGAVARLLDEGIRDAAVALMHSHRNPEHERRLAAHLRECGFSRVSCSSDVAPFIKILPRAETAVVDATLAPVIAGYLDRVAEPIGDGTLHVMTSAGGLAQPESFAAKDSLLSGPAGGVVGAARAGRRCGFERTIAFDMGGTSTDASRFDGDYDYVFEHTVGGAHLVAPALDIETVAAGGGSICAFGSGELTVGPRSAGAEPGPACYGAGGPLTLTDVNLLLGRLDPARFGIPIRPDAAERAFSLIVDAAGDSPGREQLLEGFRDIANERMADAIRQVSVRKGYDAADYALVAFGGAGGQHACGVATNLGMTTVIVPEDGSLLSATGLGHAVIERFAERQVLRALDDVAPEFDGLRRDLIAEACDALAEEDVPHDAMIVRRVIARVRFAGQDTVLPVDFSAETDRTGESTSDVPPEPTAADVARVFEAQYRDVFGHWQNRPIELESLRVVVSARRDADPPPPCEARAHAATPSRAVRAHFNGAWLDVPAFERGELTPGATLPAPALVFEDYSTTVIEPGWHARVHASGALVITRDAPVAKAPDPAPARAARRPARPDLVRLELFTNRFTTIAREMGEMLRRTALSTNVKERLDFSCALLDPDGNLVVNAPHIPVHLGAIGMCVRAVRDALELRPGDVAVTNHPAYGGSHLPDVTVITPVHTAGDGVGGAAELIGYVASRAHHAEIGGTRPGSMPPAATSLAEEGVVIAPSYLFARGEPRWETIEATLSAPPYPSRAVAENLADLKAAVAANRRGAAALVALAESEGAPTVRRFMAALEARAEDRVRAALRRMDDGEYAARERMDDGTPLAARVTIAGDRARVSFAGSGGTHPGNMNATPAIVTSVVTYVMRLLVDEPIPLNEGLLRAIEIDLPRGLLNPDFPDDAARAPAVVGGNIETSQRLTLTLIKALGLAAGSQGTMNNVVFGNDRTSYYETICGGAGAGPGFDGCSAVHTHMTNTRITDPEIVEHRYPVRVDRFAVRANSGGAGAHRGGDGAVRELTFLAPMSLSVLGQHRNAGPYGLAGGHPGASAIQRIARTSGDVESLGSVDGAEMQPGDRFIIETPGGGGYGPPD